ncbi:MAG: hypothetical protein PHC75_08075 [Burkholderiales bacterium]|nr:hypothetical protein [Burkholderiales bacterium]
MKKTNTILVSLILTGLIGGCNNGYVPTSNSNPDTNAATKGNEKNTSQVILEKISDQIKLSKDKFSGTTQKMLALNNMVYLVEYIHFLGNEVGYSTTYMLNFAHGFSLPEEDMNELIKIRKYKMKYSSDWSAYLGFGTTKGKIPEDFKSLLNELDKLGVLSLLDLQNQKFLKNQGFKITPYKYSNPDQSKPVNPKPDNNQNLSMITQKYENYSVTFPDIVKNQNQFGKYCKTGYAKGADGAIAICTFDHEIGINFTSTSFNNSNPIATRQLIIKTLNTEPNKDIKSVFNLLAYKSYVERDNKFQNIAVPFYVEGKTQVQFFAGDAIGDSNNDFTTIDVPNSCATDMENQLNNLHIIGILHNDFHLGNILSNRGKCTLIDFDQAIYKTYIPSTQYNKELLNENESTINIIKQIEEKIYTK